MSGVRWGAVFAAVTALLTACACTTIEQNGKAPRATLLDSHVHGYAMAYCLRSLGGKDLPEQEARVIREQGDRWSRIVVERSRGDFTEFFVIMRALDAALAATPMALVKDEATGGSATAPVYYCAELLRQPAVIGAMAQARARLAPAYAAD